MISRIKSWYADVYVFSESADLQPGLFDYVPKRNVIKGFNQDKLWDIWNKQKRMIMRMIEMGHKKEDCPIVLIIFDDIIGDKNIRNSEIFNNIHILGRHLCIASIVLSQEFGGKSGLPKVARANEDLVVSFYPNAHYDRDLIVGQYLSTDCVKTGQELLKNICGEPYMAIVICNFRTTLNIPEYVYKFKADPDIKTFTFPNLAVTSGPSEGSRPEEIELRQATARKYKRVVININ
jgi:hypothetical protein